RERAHCSRLTLRKRVRWSSLGRRPTDLARLQLCLSPGDSVNSKLGDFRSQCSNQTELNACSSPSSFRPSAHTAPRCSSNHCRILPSPARGRSPAAAPCGRIVQCQDGQSPSPAQSRDHTAPHCSSHNKHYILPLPAPSLGVVTSTWKMHVFGACCR